MENGALHERPGRILNVSGSRRQRGRETHRSSQGREGVDFAGPLVMIEA